MATTVSKFGPPLSELRHLGHMFTYEPGDGGGAVYSWCMGTAPAEDCPEARRRTREWYQKRRNDNADPRDLLEAVGFRAPLEALVHEAHEWQEPDSKIPGHTKRRTCNGHTPNQFCPTAQAMQRAYFVGIAKMRAIDPFPDPTDPGTGAEYMERIQEWYDRHPDATTHTEHRPGCCEKSPNPGKYGSSQIDPPFPEGSNQQSNGPRDETPDELVEWWVQLARGDIERSIPKIREYGASDLYVMGSTLALKRSPQYGMKYAICFYLLGKIARAFGAFERGELPSEDTMLDIRVYAFMYERLCQTDNWP